MTLFYFEKTKKQVFIQLSRVAKTNYCIPVTSALVELPNLRFMQDDLVENLIAKLIFKYSIFSIDKKTFFLTFNSNFRDSESRLRLEKEEFQTLVLRHRKLDDTLE